MLIAAITVGSRRASGRIHDERKLTRFQQVRVFVECLRELPRLGLEFWRQVFSDAVKAGRNGAYICNSAYV